MLGPVNDANAGWVLLARVVRPQGRRGEVLADIFTDFPETFTDRRQIFLRPTGGAPSSQLSEIRVESHWLHKGRVVLKFAHVDSIEDAEKLRGCEVVVTREDRMPLKDDAVYVSDLIGVSVVDISSGGDSIAGEIIDVEPEAAGPAMLVIRTPAGTERLIPFVRAYLHRLDITASRLEMVLPAGLLAMQAPETEQERLTHAQDREEPG